MIRFLSTPSARRATNVLVAEHTEGLISIHALREEGDPGSSPPTGRGNDFYPRPPRGGRRSCQLVLDCVYLFLSTPSARRATCGSLAGLGGHSISIHALREEGDRRNPAPQPREAHFYPRPPRGGRRRCRCRWWSPSYFYPRPPRGGRRIDLALLHVGVLISIHALREEGDRRNPAPQPREAHFYPRPP